jgi:hypothetical protein
MRLHTHPTPLRFWLLALASLAFILVYGACATAQKVTSPASQSAQYMRFPTVEANTLSGRTVVFPQATAGKVALLFVAFEQGAQTQINSWFPVLIDEILQQKQIEYYEIPMISGNYKLVSGFIDSGMRSGVPATLHDRTATFYGDRRAFFAAFKVQDLSAARLFVLNALGEVVFQAVGAATATSVGEVKRAIATASAR